MSDLWKAGIKVGAEGVTLSEADYRALLAKELREQLRKDVSEDMGRRVKGFWAPVAFVIALVGVGSFWSYLDRVVVTPFQKMREELDARFQTQARQLNETLEERARDQVRLVLAQQAAGVAAAQSAVQEQIVRQIGDPASAIGRRMADVTQEQVTRLLGDGDRRDAIERAVLRGEILDRERHADRRARAFATFMLLDPDGTERLSLLREVLSRTDSGAQDKEAMQRMAVLHHAPPEGTTAPVRVDTALADLLVARFAGGSLTRDAAVALIRRLPEADAAELLRAKLFPGSLVGGHAIELLAADGRAAAMEALAEYALAGSEGSQRAVLKALAERPPIENPGAAPGAWRRFVDAFSALGLAVVLQAPETPVEAQLALWRARVLPERAAEGAGRREATSRLTGPRGQPLGDTLGIAAAGADQVRRRDALAALLPLDGASGLPGWWREIVPWLTRPKSSLTASDLLGVVLLADRLLRPDATGADAARLALLEAMSAHWSLFTHPVGQRVAAELAHALRDPAACAGALAVIATTPLRLGPAAIAALRCEGTESRPGEATWPALAAALDAEAPRERIAAALATGLAPAGAALDATGTDWTFAARWLPELPPPDDAAAPAVARLHAVLLRRGGRDYAEALEEAGGRGLLRLAGESAGAPAFAALAAAARDLPWAAAARWEGPAAALPDGTARPLAELFGAKGAGEEAPFAVLLPATAEGDYLVTPPGQRTPALRLVAATRGAAARLEVRELVRGGGPLRLAGDAGPWLLLAPGGSDAAALRGARVVLQAPLVTVEGPLGRGAPLAAERPVTMELGAGREAFVPLALAAGERVRIWTSDLRPSEVDTVITLYGPDGRQIASDDDGAGDGWASELRVREVEEGPHVLGIRNIGAAGSFTLTHASLGAAGVPPPTVEGSRARGEAASLGRRYAMALPARGERFVRFDLAAGRAYEFRTEDLDAGVDTVLELFAPDGTSLGQDDDGGPGLASLLRVTPRQSGPHVLRVSDIRGGGGFDLIAEAR